MHNIILLVGESNSGKDSIAYLLEKDGYTILKSYTTRRKRNEEGNTHRFIRPEDVKLYQEDIIAYTKIGQYEYFSTKQQLVESDIYIIDPNGVDYMKEKAKDIKFITIYINVSNAERLNRAINIRKDDIEEVEKRFSAEKKQFDDFRLNAEFDYSVCNYDLDKAYKIVKYIIETEIGEVK